MEKYIIKDNASTIVVINGPAIMAGSIFNFLAIIGNMPPTILAITTVINKVMDTVKDTRNPTSSNKYILKKFTTAKTIPTTRLIPNSFNTTFPASLNLFLLGLYHELLK